MDASTGEFNLSAFDDDVCRTRLETMFRQIRPKELVFAKGNLSVSTTRLLRNILPSSTLWQSFKDGKEFMSVEDTQSSLEEILGNTELPDAIAGMMDKPLAMEALGGMVFYLRSLNLDKDLISQKNFNIYDPIKQGMNLVLDGQTLGHMEVLVNSEGGEDGTLLNLLQRCVTPFGKRLFRIWLTSPLKDARAINDRLDAVDDLMNAPAFGGQFSQTCKKLPDIERLISRIHAGNVKQRDFHDVVEVR
jgi:DNA mismatch repair protein MSH6